MINSIFKKVFYLILRLFTQLDLILFKIFKKRIFDKISKYIELHAITKINILNKKIAFYTPNENTKWRIENFYKLESEILRWIDSFEKTNNLIFWDIGSNIGVYSIYNSLKHPDSTSISFEPSAANLQILCRNISLNEFKNIKVFPIALTKKENHFSMMQSSSVELEPGAAHNTFGESFDYEGKKLKKTSNYYMFGTSINYVLENKILEVPDYIKIDVDGIEHLILEGANNFLKNKKIKSLVIEINENFEDHFERILKIMKENEFKIYDRQYNKHNALNNSFSKTFNYVFVR